MGRLHQQKEPIRAQRAVHKAHVKLQEYLLDAAAQAYANSRAACSSQAQTTTATSAVAVELDADESWRCICGTSTKDAGHWLCSEPPDVDYSSFEIILSAEKELTKKLGSTDIAWRTEAMDSIVEQNLSCAYYDALKSEPVAARPGLQESAFSKTLSRKIANDVRDVVTESRDIAQRYGKTPVALRDLVKDINDAALRTDPNAKISLRTFEDLDRSHDTTIL